MAENYKYLYEQMKKIVEKYHDVIEPGLRNTIDDLRYNREEVIRCRACRFCKRHPTSDMVKICTNGQWNKEYHPLVHDDDFCSYGERRAVDAGV
jgi:hypothetical protein